MDNKKIILLLLLVVLVLVLIKNIADKPSLIEASETNYSVCYNNGKIELVDGKPFENWKESMKSSSLSSPLLAQVNQSSDPSLKDYNIDIPEKGEFRGEEKPAIQEPSQAGFFGGALFIGKGCLRLSLSALQAYILYEQVGQMKIASEIGDQRYDDMVLLLSYIEILSAYEKRKAGDLILVGASGTPYNVFEDLVTGTIDIKKYLGKEGFKRFVDDYITVTKGGSLEDKILRDLLVNASYPSSVLRSQDSNRQRINTEKMLKIFEQGVLSDILPRVYNTKFKNIERYINDVRKVRKFEENIPEYLEDIYKTNLPFKEKLELIKYVEEMNKRAAKKASERKARTKKEEWIKQLRFAYDTRLKPNMREYKLYDPSSDEHIWRSQQWVADNGIKIGTETIQPPKNKKIKRPELTNTEKAIRSGKERPWKGPY